MLCKGCPFFATSLKDCWNGESLQVELPDVDSNTFNTVMEWVYRLSKPAGLEIYYNHMKVARLYKFVDFLMMENEKNALIDAYASRMLSITFADLQNIYNLELSHTKLFSLALRNCVRLFIELPSLFQDDEPHRSYQRIQDPALLITVLDCIRDYHINPWKEASTSNCQERHDHTSTPSCAGFDVKKASSIPVHSQ